MQSGNISMASETSSKFNEESRMKIDILINYFEELGWDNQKDLSQNEILLFLNKHSKQGQFDQTLAQKLFQILDVDNQNQITVEEFIKGYLQFEADLKKNNEEFNKRFMQEQNNYNNLEEQCRLYKSEKLSPEGFCENAKITVEITDVDVQKETEGINSIIIKVIYNEKTVQKKLLINKKNNNNNLIVNEKFEFKPTSRQDRFEFIMIKVDEDNIESIIGSKRFPLDQITSQEEYLVQITIPEMEGEQEIAAAIINCKIVLFWSDYEFFEEKKKKSEMKLKKIKEASNKANYYLQKIKEIYGDLKSYELGFNNNYNQNVLLNLKQNNSKLGSNDIIKDKNYSNINNYSNNTNDIQNNITNFRKNNEAGYEDSPQAQLNMGNESDMNEPLPFRAKKPVRLLGSLIILLSLIGSLKRPDFPNLVEGLLVVLCCYIGIRRGINKGLIWFKYVLIGNSVLLFYDFIWLCTHYNFMFIGDSTGGRENFIGFLSVVCCALSFLFKSALWVFLHKQYSDIKMLKENDLTNNKINDKF
jgi:hypothetical protein